MPPALTEATARAQTLTAEGDLTGARDVLAGALDPAASDPQRATPDLALAAALQARILIALGDAHGAQTWAGFAHAAEEHLHGPADERTIAAAATHAAVLHRVGSHGRAVPLYRDLVARLTEHDGPLAPRVLAAEADLATAEHAAGQCTTARNRLHDAWTRHARHHGESSPAGIKMLARLGAMERECGRTTEATVHLTRAQELCARHLPADHPLAQQVARLAGAAPSGRHVCGRVQRSTGPGSGDAAERPRTRGIARTPATTPPTHPVRHQPAPAPRTPAAPMPPPAVFTPTQGTVPSANDSPRHDLPPNAPGDPHPVDPPRPPVPRRIDPTVTETWEADEPEPAPTTQTVYVPKQAPSTVTPPPADPPRWPAQGHVAQALAAQPLTAEPLDAQPLAAEPLPADTPAPAIPHQPAPSEPHNPPAPDPTAAETKADEARAATPPGPFPPDTLPPPAHHPDEYPPGPAFFHRTEPPTPDDVPRPAPVDHRTTVVDDMGLPLDEERRLPVVGGRASRDRTARQPFVLATVLIAGIAAAAAIVAVTLPRGDAAGPATGAAATARPPEAASVPPRTSVPAADEGAPDGVKIKDNRDSVSLSWRYPKDADGPVLISGGRAGQEQRAFQQLAPGTAEYVVYGLNAQVDYCFTVAVVYGVDRVATSTPACTSR
ncbi:hypothetical protein [Symbioplanes lichenis]|uniref:hypothetical protein n=1 Tax=Symbioplanes lichenis TaxID=1629072 RepID=UPI002738D9DA|nr:hypothetical protein [Actinoplanes lichenis]